MHVFVLIGLVTSSSLHFKPRQKNTECPQGRLGSGGVNTSIVYVGVDLHVGKESCAVPLGQAWNKG